MVSRPIFVLATIAIALTGVAASLPQWTGFSLQLGGAPVAASNAVLSEHELGEIELIPAQQQAERLLERAINGYKGALEQIEGRAAGWVGKIELNEKLHQLTYVAYCSSNLRVRAAAIEISLAGYGLEKSPASVQAQLEELRGPGEKKFYPLWKLGLLGNRGVEPAAVRQALLDYLTDTNQTSRLWAVNGLGMLGTDDAIEPLLGVFRNDPSPEIRERAACNLADSGMFTREQRWKALPGLMQMMDDPHLDAQTRGWVYQALREISGEGTGADPSLWRDWWTKQRRGTE